MATLFDDIQSQFIDGYGKARILNYENSSLIVSPIPPLNVKSAAKKDLEDVNFIEATFEDAVELIKDKDLQIVSKDGNPDEGIQGLWVTPKNNQGISSGYIPLKPIKSPDNLKDVAYTEMHQNDPIRTDGKKHSILDNYRKKRKIAHFLKEYTLYTYSVLYHEGDKKFGGKNFIIIPEHIYDIERLDKRLYIDGNDVIYSPDRKIIVTSKEVTDRLLSYLNVILTKDPAKVLEMNKQEKISDYYQSISDFRKTNNSLVFSSKEGLFRWYAEKQKKSTTEITETLNENTEEPYFYRSVNVYQNHLCIIQNVEDGSLENAKAVSWKWIKDKVNIGYYGGSHSGSKAQNVKHIVYTERGTTSGTKHKKGYAPVILYENGTYGALLILT